jgi:hypothetical protein
MLPDLLPAIALCKKLVTGMKILEFQHLVGQSQMLKITDTSLNLICYQSRHPENGLKNFAPHFQRILQFAGLAWLQTGA